MLDAVASQPHYADHLAPVWRALPAEARGHFYAATRPVAAHMERLGLEPTLGSAKVPGGPLLTAGFHDVRVAHPSRPVAYLEHGSGQSYRGDSHVARQPSYPGGAERGRIGLFLVPHEHSARAERDAYPDAIVAVVGCPRLDPWAPVVRPHGLVVALAWHWPLRLVPETHWAFPEWRDRVLSELRDDPEVTLLGSGHPRAWGQLGRWYEKQGIEAVPDAAQVLERADVVVADTTSLMYEAMACGIGVVALNSRGYRRQVEHGLRFWARCPEPSLWPDAPEGALAHAVRVAAEPGHRMGQMRSTEDLYPPWTRGRSAHLAAEALLAWLRLLR